MKYRLALIVLFGAAATGVCQGPGLPLVKNPQTKVEAGGLKVTVFLDNQVDQLIGDLIWTPKGDAFYVLTRDGVLRLIALPKFEVVKQVELGPDCVSLALSSAGPLITRGKPHFEVCHVDPATFKIARKFPIERVKRAVSAPGLPFALITMGDFDVPGTVGHLDLVMGKMVNVTTAATGSPQITPDGKHYFAWNNLLVRYRIEGTHLVEVGRGGDARIKKRIGPDNRLFFSTTQGSPRAPARTEIFEAEDIGTPLFMVGADLRAMAFDPKTQLYLSVDDKHQLAVYNKHGVRLKDYQCFPPYFMRLFNQLVPHPDGGKFLLATKIAALVELPADCVNWNHDAVKPSDTEVHPDGMKNTVIRGLNVFNLADDLVLARKADAFYALAADGVLSRVSLRTFEIEKQTVLGPTCSGLALSTHGLLVVKKDTEQVWVVDAGTLEVKNKIAVPMVQRVLPLPGAAVAFVTTGRENFADGLVVTVDLAQGKATGTTKAPVKFARLTPDGKYYLAFNSRRHIVRYRVQGTVLSEDDRSDQRDYDASIQVSPDGKWLGVGRWVFRVDDLLEPLLPDGNGGRENVRPYLGFDPSAKLLFAHTDRHALVVCNLDGTKIKDYLPHLARGETRQFLVFPEGRKLLVRTQRQVFFVELPPESARWAEESAKKKTDRPAATKVHPDGMKATRVRGAQAYKLVGDLLWMPRGDAFFALTSDGILRRFLLHDLEVDREVRLGAECSSLALSRDRLLVVKKDPREICLIDPATFEVKGKIPVPRVHRVLCHPDSPFALVIAGDEREHGEVGCLDLNDGKISNWTTMYVNYARWTPDGKYYFTHGGGELHRYRVDDRKLVEDGKSGRINDQGHSLSISADSKLVSIECNTIDPRGTTDVFRVEDIRKPLRQLRRGNGPLGFDPPAGLVYARTPENLLNVFNMDGIRLKEYLPTGNTGEVTLHFAVHPQGRRVLVTTSKQVLLVELPADGGF